MSRTTRMLALNGLVVSPRISPIPTFTYAMIFDI